MKEKEASNFVPYEYVGENYCITSFGTVVFGIDLKLTEAFTMDAGSDRFEQEEQGDRQTVSKSDLWFHGYKSALLGLPACTIQKVTDIYTLPHQRVDSDGSKTRRWNEEMFQFRDVVFTKDMLLVSFKLKQDYKKKGLFDALIKRVKSFEGVTEIPQFERQFRSFFSSLSGVCLEAKEMSGDEIVDAFVCQWNHDRGTEQNDTVLSDVSILPNVMVFGNKYRAVLSSRNLPETINGFSKSNTFVTDSERLGLNDTVYRQDINLPTSFLYSLGAGFPYKHTIVETIEIVDKERVDAELTKSNSALNLLITFNNRDAIKKRQHIGAYKDVSADHDMRYVKYGITIVIENEKLEVLNRLTDMLVDISRKKLNLVLNVENRGSWKQWFSSLPGCGHLNSNLRYSFLEVACYMTHIESFKTSNSRGVMMCDLAGNPFLFDDWDHNNKFLEARNGVVFGPTGSGKSFTVNHKLDAAFNNGDFIFIVDVGGSYSRITKLNGGEFIDSKPLTKLSFNPFLDCYKRDGLYFPDLNAIGEKDNGFVDGIVYLILACWKPEATTLDKELFGILKTSIKSFYNKINEGKVETINYDSWHEHMITLGDRDSNTGKYISVSPLFFELESFDLVMGAFRLDGDYGFFLNSEKTFDVNNRWVCFDLTGVVGNQSMIVPALIMVIQQFDIGMARWYGRQCRMFLEEAVDFLQSGFFASYIGELYRKIRKMGGQVYIVTQSITFLDSISPLTRDSIFSNTQVIELCDHSKNMTDLPLLQKAFSLKESDLELLRNQAKSEGSPYRLVFMKFGNMDAFLYRLEVSAKTRALYQTNATEIKIIDALIEKSGVEGGVNEYVELTEKK